MSASSLNSDFSGNINATVFLGLFIFSRTLSFILFLFYFRNLETKRAKRKESRMYGESEEQKYVGREIGREGMI